MKTYRVTRIEKIQEVKIIKAKNEDDAIEKMTYDNWDDCEILSSEIDTEEVQLWYYMVKHLKNGDRKFAQRVYIIELK